MVCESASLELTSVRAFSLPSLPRFPVTISGAMNLDYVCLQHILRFAYKTAVASQRLFGLAPDLLQVGGEEIPGLGATVDGESRLITFGRVCHFR